jgi:Domain of Unknown Function (DUF1080)
MRNAVPIATLLLIAWTWTGLVAGGDGEQPDRSWRSLPLIEDGKVDKNWTQIGWGGFVVDGDSLGTDCDEKGMGLLLYEKERFGNCQIRVVYRCKDSKSNSGVFVRLVDIDGKRVTTFDPDSKDVPRDRKWYEPKREPKRPRSGYIGLQNHDPGDIAYFKAVSVRPLDAPP